MSLLGLHELRHHWPAASTCSGALSSTEAGYVAIAEGFQEAIFSRYVQIFSFRIAMLGAGR